MMTIDEAALFVSNLQARLKPFGLESAINTEGLNQRDIRHVADIVKEYCTERPKKVAAPPEVKA